MRFAPNIGCSSEAPAALAIKLPICSSCFQFGYFAHALKRHLIADNCGGVVNCGRSVAFGWGRASGPALTLLKRAEALVPALSRAGAPAPHGKTNAHPESLVQTRFVGQRSNRTLSCNACARPRVFRDNFSAAASLTMSSTLSCRVR